MALNFNDTNINHLKVDSRYVAALNYNGTIVWAEMIGTIQHGSAYPAGIKSVFVTRTASLEPSALVTPKSQVTGNLYNGDTLYGEFTAADYWAISPTTSTRTLSVTPGTEQTWNIFGTNGVFSYPVATRVGRSLTVSGNGMGTLSVTYAKQTDGESATVSKTTAADSATYTCWAGADISWSYSYISVDRTASTTWRYINKRWTYYPTTYSGTITKGTDAITIKGPYNVTPTSKSYITFSEFTSSTSDKTIAPHPAVASGGSKTGTFLTSLTHLFIYKETGIKIVGTYTYALSTPRSFEVYLNSSTSTNTFNVVNTSGNIVGSVEFTLNSTAGSGITWVKKNSSTTTMTLAVSVTDVQVYAFSASNPYPVAITAGVTRMTLTNNETVSQYITYTGGTFSTSNGDYEWVMRSANCTTLASGGTDSWGATDVADSASEDYCIYYDASDAGWEVWNAYFNKPYVDQMDNYE